MLFNSNVILKHQVQNQTFYFQDEFDTIVAQLDRSNWKFKKLQN